MSSDVNKYLSLMSKFLSDEMSAVDFQSSYLDLFKNESEQLDSVSFGILDAQNLASRSRREMVALIKSSP